MPAAVLPQVNGCRVKCVEEMASFFKDDVRATCHQSLGIDAVCTHVQQRACQQLQVAGLLLQRWRVARVRRIRALLGHRQIDTCWSSMWKPITGTQLSSEHSCWGR